MDTTEKIRPEEVSVLSAGEQIRRKVLGAGATIEEFARDIEFYPVSVKQYLRRNDGGSSSFKIKLTQYFRQGYDEIVKTPAEQLAEKCRNLSENIYLYTEEADAVVISDLFVLIKEAELHELYPWMHRNLALNCFYRNLTSEAIELLHRAENAVRDKRNAYAQATFTADLALVNYYLCEYETAFKWIQESGEAQLRLPEPNATLQYLVAFRRGVIHTKAGRYPEAVSSLKTALKVAGKETFVGLANLHLAEAKYKCGRVKEAKASYRRALEAFENDPLRQSFVYTSFAEMLLSENDIQRAALFSEKALRLCCGDNRLFSFQHFETYARIQIRMGKQQQVCETLIDMIQKNSSEFVYRSQMLDALKILMECFSEIGVNLTQRMEELVTMLIEGAGAEEHSYTRELKSLRSELLKRKATFGEAIG